MAYYFISSDLLANLVSIYTTHFVIKSENAEAAEEQLQSSYSNSNRIDSEATRAAAGLVWWGLYSLVMRAANQRIKLY